MPRRCVVLCSELASSALYNCSDSVWRGFDLWEYDEVNMAKSMLDPCLPLAASRQGSAAES